MPLRPLSLATAALVVLLATPAEAGEATLDLGAAAGLSTWEGDAAGTTMLRAGYRIDDWIGLHGEGRLGYAGVDERVLVLVGLGAQLWGTFGDAQPFFRLTLTHQHEEPVDAIPNDIFGTLFGVGDGIRHRAGLEPALGLDYVLWRDGPLDVVASAEASFQLYPDERGPKVYFFGGFGMGIRHDL
jgi:hypothetical protein